MEMKLLNKYHTYKNLANFLVRKMATLKFIHQNCEDTTHCGVRMFKFQFQVFNKNATLPSVKLCKYIIA